MELQIGFVAIGIGATVLLCGILAVLFRSRRRR